MATNVLKPNRSSNAFRLNPEKLVDKSVYREIPYGIYFSFAHTQRGFHIRFRDIARGGIRIVKSNDMNQEKNRHSLFKENFNLAQTQKLKNKDIAENGSKGVINIQNGYD